MRNTAFGIVTFVSAVACGGGSYSGSVHGQPFQPVDALSTVVKDFGGNTPLTLVISDTAGACANSSANQRQKNARILMLLVQHYEPTLGRSVSPDAAGVYLIEEWSDPNHEAKFARGFLQQSDASCNPIASDDSAIVSGSITFDSAKAGSYEGSYDLMLTGGDHITGRFSAPDCPAFNDQAGKICG